MATSCGARMRTDVNLLAYRPGDGRSPRAVIQPVWLRLGLGGAVMTSQFDYHAVTNLGGAVCAYTYIIREGYIGHATTGH